MSNERVTVQVDAIGNFSSVIGEVNKLQSRLQSLKLPSNLNTKFEGSLKNIMDKYNQFQTLANKGIQTKGDFSKLNSSAKELESSIRNLKKELNGVTEQKLRVQVDNLPEVKALEKEIERLKKTYTELNNLGTKKIQGVFGEDEVNKIRNLVGESKNLKPALNKAFDVIKTGNISEGLKELDKLESALHRINGGALTNFQKGNPNRKSEIQAYINAARAELNAMDSDTAKLNANLNQLKADKFNQMASGVSAAKAQLDNLGNSAARSTREILNTARATQNMETQLSGLQTQANYFFGLQNMIQLFRRGLSDTIQTVRDLDKAMTDTAVVTDMTVGDLWAQLPDYTKLANKLGATTQGAYETMTLYYQQGLNKQETFEIGEETMKMARIAGLDYAQTTNMMTAALRGFNMELNQTSAKRVNDVYSELAAITASDTRELGLAMERTASIAHSANMDFGNTTAFLAQMIETTREAPENLGTAMKTIIARFQELKQNPYEISEVEGEEVDFNRVDKALKSIGVDLMDNRDKFRDLDDVFMDISSKWDGLSQTQQRYIATMAAGSRQQSRFLAMVQNYDRLKELTDAAANSEGASDVQFSKTLDSMEAKLNKLNNAWDQFAMGITNSDLIKKGTGALVKILDVVNKFETGVEHAGDKIGGVFGDIFKSITSFTGLLLGFKGLGKLTDIGIGMLGGMLGMGKGVGAGMFGGISGMRQATNMAQANAISNPIVAAINKLTAVMTKGKVTDSNQSIYGRGVGREEFKNRRKQLRGLAVDEYYSELEGKIKTPKSFGIGQFKGAFKDLNKEEQAALYRSQKGTRSAIQRSFEDGIKNLNVSDSAQKAASTFYTDLDYAMANGSQHIESGLTEAFDPVKVGKVIGGDAGAEIYKAALEQRKNIIRDVASQKGADGKPLRGKELEKAWRSKEASLYGQNIKLNNDEVGKLTSRMNGLTSAANNTGAAFMQVGMTMQAMGFEKLGGIIGTAGSALLSFGMMAETASHGLKVLKTEAAGAYAALAGAAPVLAIAGGVLAAAFIAYKIKQKQIKDIRKSGKEVVDTYEETTKSVSENLNKLSKYQDEWGKWSSGVDENGNNINLGTEEYQDYKKAVKDIVKMQPELIKGYNAEGEAIIDNKHALQEAIKLEKQREKDATKKYIDEGQKIVDRRNTTKRWQKGQSNKIDATGAAMGETITASYNKTSQKSTIEKDAQKVADAIKQIDGGESVLKKWGITFDALGNITEDSINIIRDYGGEIQNELVKSYDGQEITDAQQRLLDNSNDAIAQLGKDFKGVEDASKETFDALKVYATQQGVFESLDGDLITPYQKALGRIAEKDISWKEMQNEADALGKKYQGLGGHLSDFHDIQKQVEEAQKQFGQNLDTQNYKNTVKDLTKPLDEWINSLRKSSDEADKILADYLENQKAKMLDIGQAVGTIGDAFNTMSGSMAAANSVYENWQKQNERGDLYTAADEMRKMYEEVNDNVDNLAKGSNQWWSAMEAIVGSDYVWSHSKEEVASYAKTVSSFFEEGKAGAKNFKDYLASSEAQGKQLDTEIFGFKKGNEPFTVADFIKKTDGGVNLDKLDNLTSGQLDSLGETLVGSAESFAAAMSKASQYYNINFGSAEQMRKAIGASGYSLAGEGFEGENRHLYYRRDEFRREGREQNLNHDQIKRFEKQVEDNYGVILTDGVKEVSKQLPTYLKDWGITDKNGQTSTDSFIKYFDKLQYNQGEISQLYDKAVESGLISDKNKVDFNEEYQKAVAANRDPSVQAATSIDGNVGSILGVVQSIAVAMGVLTKENKSEINQGIKDTEEATTNLGRGKEGVNYEEARKEVYDNVQALKETKAQLEAGQLNYKEDSEKWKEYQKQIDKIDNQLEKTQNVWDNMTEDTYNRLVNISQLQEQKSNAEKAVKDSTGVSKSYKDTAINDNNRLNTDKLSTLINAVKEKVDEKDQTNVIGQYLQNSTKALVDNNASGKEIKASMQAAAKEMADNKMKPADIAAALNQSYGTKLTGKDVTEEGKITAKLDPTELQAQLKDLHADVTANITKIQVAATGRNNPNSAFHRTGTMARGSRKGYTIPGRPTLMGEEGEEVVWEPKRNEAYIVGSNGPQFGNISNNAVVWNAEQTKRIKKNSKTTGSLGTGAKGITPIGTMKGGNAGGGGLKIPGLLSVDAKANIQDVVQPTEKPEVSVKAKLDVEGSEKGGLVNKVKGLFGKGNSGPTVKVTAEATKINVKEQAEAIKLTGDIVKLNNKADNVKGIEATATVTKVTKSGQVAGEPVKVQATASTTSKVQAQPKKQQVSAGTQTMTVTANTAPAMAKIRALTNLFNRTYTLKYRASGPGHIKVPISANFTGSWQKTVTINKSGAKGINNHIAHRIAPSFGSAAKGRRGTLGPNNRGGLTLTGEKGYEIAWLPSENRSMILGVNGPQMLALPSDAVIWNHKQSEEILKKKQAIPAGSMVNGDMTDSGGGGSTTKKKKKKKKKKSKKKGKKNKDKNKGTINNFSMEEVVRFNIDPALARLTSEIEKRSKEIEKSLTKIGNTYGDIVDSTNKQIAALQGVKDKNQALYNSYQRQLAELRGQKGSVSWTDDKGKSHDKTINFSSFLNPDGSVNQAAIQKLSTRAEREATFNLVSGAAKPLVDGMQSAQKAMEDAVQQMEDLGQKISEAFYQWKSELTEVYDLTQRINDEVSFTDRFTSQIELELAKLGSGFGDTAESIKNIRKVLIRSNDIIKKQIANQQQMIAARQRELEAALSYEDEIAQRQAFEASDFGGNAYTKKATVEWAKGLEAAAIAGRKYVQDVYKDIDGSIQYRIDWAQFNADRDKDPINKSTYEAIKSYLDDLNNAATEFNNAIKDQTDFIKQTYESLKEYQDKIVDFEDTLIDGVEEEIKNETENAKKISSSIANALKDLLDEVKRKLDERRKQEDNAKTERDIAQKQQRLAALRADTAGGHQVEIAQLEKEIADAQQDYGRTLEDQLLDRLQQQADKASEQRERQIELAETSNEISAANNKELVDMWLREPEKYKEEIKAAWLEANGYDEKGEAGQYVLRNQFESDFAELVTAVEQTDFKNHFNQLEADTNSLVALLQELTNGSLGRYDELALDENALLDATKRNTDSIVTLVEEQGKMALAQLKAQGVDVDTLKLAGYGANELAGAGYTAKELREGGFSLPEIVEAGYNTIEPLKEAGYTASEIKGAGVGEAAKDFKDAGFEAKDLKDIFTSQDLIDALFDASSLREAGIDAGTLKAANFTAAQLKAGGYTAAQLKTGGYNQYDLGAGSYSYNEARQVYTAAELKSVSQYAAAADKEIKDAEAARIKAQRYNAYISQLQAVKKLKPKNVKASHVNSLFNYGAAAGYGKASVLLHLVGNTGGSDPFSWKNIFKAIIDADGITRYNLVKTWPNGNGTLASALATLGNPDTYSEIKKHKNYRNATALRYATGGLADYTGPAWLDGTPSKPELVLNAADTKNFLALKDVLSRAVHSSNSISNSYGDATYEININVDHLNNDYDVDRVAERVKKIIVKDAGYRNVTQVRNFR